MIKSALKLLINTKNCRRVGGKIDELPLILKPLLFAICGVYTGLVVGYLYLYFAVRRAKQQDFVRRIFLANGCICLLILILTGVLLGVGWADPASAGLVLWVS